MTLRCHEATYVKLMTHFMQRARTLMILGLCQRWVLRLLKETEMEKRVTDSRKFLRWHQRNRNFLDKILKMDKIWVHLGRISGSATKQRGKVMMMFL